MKQHAAVTNTILDVNQNKQALKQQYVECLGATSTAAITLRTVVIRLVELGVDRPELVAWAAEAGYRQGYARTLLSKILCELGLRARKSGAGRHPKRRSSSWHLPATDLATTPEDFCGPPLVRSRRKWLLRLLKPSPR